MSDLTPRTEAGRRLLGVAAKMGMTDDHHLRADILAIEAEMSEDIGWVGPVIVEAGDQRAEYRANPQPIPDTPSLREAAAAIQDNAVIPDEYEDYCLVRRDDYAALGNALRPILTADPEAEAERNFSTRSIKG